MEAKRLIFVRHPEPDFGGQSTPFLGRTDLAALKTPLDAQCQSLKTLNFDQIMTSPSLRCSQLAEALAQQKQKPFLVDETLLERDFGSWDGLNESQLPAESLSAYFEDPIHFAIPEAETFFAMQKRIHLLLKNLQDNEASCLLIITHGGVMRLVLQKLLSLPDNKLFNIKVHYGCQLHIDVYAQSPEPFYQLVAIKE